ncbi:MFS transporter [Nonomuraea sp. NPDC048826]|uniref:MFS transporter n=1 Tax=Nonomuraea sp. NPDC048826 TaxID=3364347 RepID=UPI00371FA8FA
MSGTPRAGRREWLGLAVLACPTLLLSIDVFVLLLALPSLSAELGASGTEQLWITDIYGFMIAGFLVTMGTLGDRIGRRRLLMIGAAAFGAASVLAAYAESPAMLIATRAVMGVAGATLMPSTLALISNMFQDARQRATAISVWMVCFVAGAAIGPLVGGALLEHFWWGSVFLLGVPVMLVLMATAPVLLPEYRDPRPGRLDLVSVVLSLGAILPIVYGLKEAAKHGPEPVPLLSLAAGLAVGVVFVRRQRRLDDPLMDLRLFQDRAFGAALGMMLSGTLLMGSLMLFITQFFQLVAGLGPLTAGLWMLPGVAASVLSTLAAPAMAQRIRPAYVIGGGLVVSIAGLVLLTQVGAGSGPLMVAIGFAVINLGSGPMVVLGTDLIVGLAPKEKAGAASALNETSGEFGFALGLATLGTLGTAVYRAGAADLPVAEARDTLAGAVQAAGAGELAAGFLAQARLAFIGGLHVTAAIAAVMLAVVTVVTVVLLRHVPRTGTPAESSEEAALPAS